MKNLRIGKCLGNVAGNPVFNTAIVIDQLLDIDGAANRLNVTPRFIRRLIAERRIPHLKIGKFIRFDPDELEDWIQHRRVQSISSR